jgi:DNA-binding MarR family transcriptional regulator
MQHFLPHLLEQTNRLVRDMLNNTLSAEDLQTDQWTILVYLSDGLGHAMGELAEAAAINPSKLTKCVDKLVSKGLMHRSVDLNDQRKVVAMITDRGLAIVSRLNPEIAKLEKLLISRLGRSDHKQLKHLLTQMLIEDDDGHRPA